MMRSRLLALLLLAPFCQAQVYTYIDAEGNRVFTDSPRNGNAKQIILAPTNSTQMPKPQTSVRTPQAVIKPVVHYEMLRILMPEPDATIQSPAGDLIVSATSEPALLEGHVFRLLLDGQVQGEPSRSPVFSLHNIDRGTHMLAVEIIDAAGLTVERTPAQPFHLQRITLAQKRRITPCKLTDFGVRPECPLKDKPEE